MNKYKILENESIAYEGRTLYRIEALRDFGDVKAGDLGGYVESEKNLSQDGECWVYGEAKVYEDARVYGDAMVYYNAEVCDRAQVYGEAEVYEFARVYGDAEVYDKADVHNSARIYGNAKICGKALVYGIAEVGGDMVVRDEVVDSTERERNNVDLKRTVPTRNVEEELEM